MKFILLLFLLSYNFYNGQVKRFIYDYAFVSDSTKPQEITKEVMFLDVVKGKSQFYSAEQYKVDSALAADGKKGIFSMPPNKNLIRYKVQKTETTATIESEMDGQKYLVKDERILNWKILKDTDTLSGFPVQKAELNFAGRNWIAWFTTEIPIQEGPYKFRGLPGLILKIQDKKGNHLFLISGIINLNDEFLNYPESKNVKSSMKINHDAFIKLYKTYRKDPLKSLRGRIPDQTDTEGNFRTGTEIFRDEENYLKEKLKRDNNIIELDLLKN